MLSKSDRERQMLYDLTYMWHLNIKTKKQNKTETDSQVQEANYWFQKWEWLGVATRAKEMKRHKLPVIK